MSASSPARPSIAGSLWMLLAAVLFAAMGALVKAGARQFSAPELVFYRCVFGLVVLGLGMHVRGQSPATPRLRLHLRRSLTGSAGMLLHFSAIAALPLATAVTLNYTSPLFLTLGTIVLLGERPRPRMIFAVILGFAGIACLLHPTLERNQLGGGLIGLAGGACGGLAYLSTRELGRAGEPPWRVVFYFSLVATVVSGLWAAWLGFHPLHLDQLPTLLAMAASATLAQLTMTRAYRDGHVLIVGSLSYATVVFTAVIGAMLWGEIPGPAEWLGIALVVGSALLSVLVRGRG